MNEQDTPEFRYLVWRIAAASDRRPWQLGAQERGVVERQAAREQALILRTTAAREAQAVAVDPAVVREAVAELGKGYADAAAFRAELARAGLNEADLTQAIGAELRAGLVLEQVTAAVRIDDAAVNAYFEANRARLQRPELRTARHILITINEEYAENRRERARERMESLASELARGAEFGLLARQHSECPTAMEAGLLGRVRNGQLYAELDTALFAMDAGELSAVLESPVGFHLLRCDAVEPARSLSLEEAAPAIRKHLEQQARKRTVANWLAAQAH